MPGRTPGALNKCMMKSFNHPEADKSRPARKEASQPELLVISEFFRPRITGTARVVENLLVHLDRSRLVLLTGYGTSIPPAHPLAGVPIYPLSCRHNFFRWPWLSYLSVLWIVLQGLGIVRRHQIREILVIFPSAPFVIGADWLSRLSGCPLHVYYMDPWEEGSSDIHHRSAQMLEKRILQRAATVFAINPPLHELLVKKSGRNVVHLPLCLAGDIEVPDRAAPGPPPHLPAHMVFTGTIYQAQADALQNAVKAMGILPPGQLLLDLYTTAPAADLEAWGLSGAGISRGQANPEEVVEIQKQAAILFLPLSFHPRMRAILGPAMPSKASEYMNSGVPILVHAPPEYFLSRFAREFEWALVCDRNDPQALAQAIAHLLGNRQLRDRLVENAYRAAAIHDGKTNARRFQEAITGSTDPGLLTPVFPKRPQP